MNLRTRKASGMIRRGTAFVMAVAVGVSMLASAPSAKAVASKRTPLLGVKKKTLYYNKTSKKKYTLKIKKNQVKSITGTTWKTSKKSVVAISSRKKKSVKLTAKKKGTSVITATVSYIPKGGWWHRSIKLKCKVTSKKASVASPVKTPKPVQTQQPAVSKAASVMLNQTSVLLSKAEGYNTVSLTATVQDAKGNVLPDDDVQWVTDNAAVAAVDDDGTVTAVRDGTAYITASMDGVISSPCVVTVDTVSPTITEKDLTGSRTVTVYFSESVKGNPVVSIRRNTADESTYVDAVLAKGGKSMALTSAEALTAGTYVFTIEGLTDQAGNELKYNQITVTKDASITSGFVCKTEQVPVGQSKVLVYYALVDQYGDECAFEPINDLEIKAETESGMPLDARACHDGKRGWIEISGAVGALGVGRRIQITLNSESLGLRGMISTLLVSAEGVGEAVRISGITTTGMKNEGTELSPVFTLGSGDNVFSFKANLLDKFELPVETSKVIYVIEDTSVLVFEDTEAPNTAQIHTSDQPVHVKALKGGETTLTAYLASDDTVRLPIKIKINPNKLTGIEVASPPYEGINGQAMELETTLSPAGTGLTASDLSYKVEEGTIEDFDLNFVEEEGKFYTKLAAKTNGKENTLTFRVVYNEIESEPVTYQSAPLTSSVSKIKIDSFNENEVTAGGTAETEYSLLNRYGEDITALWKGEIPQAQIQDADVITKVNVKPDGHLEIETRNQGATYVTLSVANKTETLKVTVVAKSHISRIVLKEAVRGKLKLNNGAYTSYEKTYIEIDHVEDQYGNGTYELTAEEFSELLGVKAGEKEKSSLFTFTPCKENTASAGDFVPLKPSDPDCVEAVLVEWKENIPSSDYPKAGADCVVDFLYGGTSVLEENKCTIEIQEARKPDSIRIENAEKGRVVPIDYTVTHTIVMKDQYGDVLGMPENSSDGVIEVKAVELESKRIVTGTSPTCGSEKKWMSSVTIDEPGTYTVYAYVKEKASTTYETAAIKSEYALRVDTTENLIEKLAVSNQMTKGHTSMDLDALEESETDYIYVRPGKAETVTFEPVAMDADGNEITLSSDTANEIVWKAVGSGGITVEKNINPNGSFTIKGDSSGSEGTVEVTASYFVGSDRIESAPRIIKVKCEKAIPQKDTYQIQLLHVDENGNETLGEEDYKDKGLYEFSSADPSEAACRFRVTALDQNGAPCENGDIQLDAVTITEKSGKAAAVISKGRNDQVDVSITQWGEVQVNVFLADGSQYTFSVAAKPDVMTAGLHDCKGEIQGPLYDEGTYEVVTSLDRENSTETFTVVNVQIKCQNLIKHWNNADPKEKGYWAGVLVPMKMKEGRCCVHSNKKASDIMDEIALIEGNDKIWRKEKDSEKNPPRADFTDKNGNDYWAFYYDKGRTDEDNNELQGYAVMKDSGHYVIYMFDLSGISVVESAD